MPFESLFAFKDVLHLVIKEGLSCFVSSEYCSNIDDHDILHVKKMLLWLDNMHI